MIAQMRTLLRVKDLKLEQAERAMQAKRAQREAARQEREEAERIVAESTRTYFAREDAIYDDIMGRQIGQDVVDETRGRVVQLEKSHAALKDDLERALHVEARLEQELQVATAAFFAAERARDKFTIITDDLQQTANAIQEGREEVEVEDLFARPRRRAG
jgi:hypothetical protein